MAAARSIVCLISGKSFVFSPDYYAKRVEEYGSVENLKKYFVTKKVKSLIERGYNVQEIRNILAIDEKTLLDSEDQEVKDVITYHSLRCTSIAKRTSCNFATHKSDKDVAEFINNIKNTNYES